MDDNLLDSYLEKISEQVLDENKIVTYKYLSKSLGVHINTAKQLLHVYITKVKSKNAFPISATYLVAGKVVDGSVNITIVNETDLKQAHLGFLEVTSEHVYSIQKTKSLKDVKVLCGVDRDIPKPKSCDLVIKCSRSVLKARKGPKKEPESCEAENQKILKEALAPEKEEPKVRGSPKKASPKKNSEKVQTGKKPTGNIANFFAKRASKNSEKPVKNEPMVVLENKKEVESRKLEGKTTETTEKKTESKNTAKRNKRKRIQMLSDSEESDSNEDEDIPANAKEDSHPPIAELEEKEEAVELVPKNKRKKRKVVDKTVMNEDGYLETKKEVVYETDSEYELEEAITKDTEKPKEEKKVQSGSGFKKQASLLNFFKRN